MAPSLTQNLHLVKRVLIIAAHRKGRSPGQRFRFEQYLDILEDRGYKCEVSYIIDEDDDKMLYSRGNHLEKAAFLHKCTRLRKEDAKRSGNFDIILIFREALLSRSTRFERKMAKTGARIIFDFDDAIWLPNVSSANRYFSWMKNPNKTRKIISVADLVIAGNRYLADYAGRYNKRVRIIPTTIDTEEYLPRQEMRNREEICIGWSGSITTIEHFKYAIPFLTEIRKKYGKRVVFKVIGSDSYEVPELDIKGTAWSAKNERRELNTFDIGVMPLPNDRWSRGKCGLKALQYMAMEIPTVCSPVGVNTEIIDHGINGFLAGKMEEWVAILSELIDNEEKRRICGREGRKTVVEKYSVKANAGKYLSAFDEVLHSKS